MWLTMGFSFTTSHQAFKIKDNLDPYTTSGGLGTMGFGLPAAIGAKMGKPNSEVIAVIGDGGFQMNIQELATVLHNKIPLKIFIFNNGGYLTIKQTQILGFKGRIMGADKNSGLSFPNYKEISKAHNITYKKTSYQKKFKSKNSQTLKKKFYL